MRSFFLKLFGNAFANATGATGDDDYFILECMHGGTSLRKFIIP